MHAIAYSLSAQNSASETLISFGSFDTPLKKKVVDFGPSPYYPSPKTAPHIKLSCFYFPTFMVNEYDEGQKGATWLRIVPISNGSMLSCTRSHHPDEKAIDWFGYFEAVKANLVFFNGADGQDGGMPFAVFDSRTGKKIFEDLAYDSSFVNMRVEVSQFNKLRVGGSKDGISLRYLRVVAADCDLDKEKATCWQRMKAKLGVESSEVPVCVGYKDIPTPCVSAVAYPVEVRLSSEPVIKTITGPVRCWPVD